MCFARQLAIRHNTTKIPDPGWRLFLRQTTTHAMSECPHVTVRWWLMMVSIFGNSSICQGPANRPFTFESNTNRIGRYDSNLNRISYRIGRLTRSTTNETKDWKEISGTTDSSFQSSNTLNNTGVWSLIELASLYTVPLSTVNGLSRLTTTNNG